MRRITFAAALAMVAFSCGDNLLKSTEKSDPPEDATLDLEHNDPDAAISTLNAALAKDPGNAQDLSILALAYAQRAGIQPLEFATQLAQAQGTNSGGTATATVTNAAGAVASGENFSAVFAVLPDATTSNLSDLDEAVSILTTQIPPAELQPGDTFKIAIFNTGDFMLHLKSLDTNGDGIIEPDELVNLSDSTASTLVTLLSSAAAAFGANPSDATSQQAQAAIAQYQSQINAEPGSSDADKLKNYLSANPGAASEIGSATFTGTGTGTSTGS